MNVAQTSSSRPRRARVERGKRSKNGCKTCIRKKVKCDEERPDCGRCARLHLTCDWTDLRSPLSEARRGLGPIKSRNSNSWSPCLILPKAPTNDDDDVTSSDDVFNLVTENAQPPLQEAIYLQSSQSLLTEQSTNQVFPIADDINVADDPLNGLALTLDCTSSLIDHGISNETSAPQGRLHDEQEIDDGALIIHAPLLINLKSILPVTDMSFLSIEAYDLAPSHFNDNQAADFYRMVFAPLRSTKVPATSAHFFFADYVRTKRMASHFLLAVSHNEISTFYGRVPGQTSEALQHFAIASNLFLQNLMSANGQHIEMMLSFLYIYHFWLRRPAWNSPKFLTLSTAIAIYVKTHRLDLMCASQDISVRGQHHNGSISTAAILSRILIYLFDRDGFCAFAGIGGILATYACQHEGMWQKIWQVSNTAFAPASASEAVILTLYFELTIIHQHINCYGQGVAECPVVANDLRRRLRDLREAHTVLFDQTASINFQSFRLPIMALVAVTFFSALQIYLCRSRSISFGERPEPMEIQQALLDLLRTAHHTTRIASVRLLERFQWSMLIAAAETHDLIHLDWLEENISDIVMEKVFHKMLRIKKQNAGRISIQQLRILFVDSKLSADAPDTGLDRSSST